MTIQVINPAQGKSKKALEEALNSDAGAVDFFDPSKIEGSRGHFTGSEILPGRFPVVMDHPKRMRFATVQRKPDGKFKVS